MLIKDNSRQSAAISDFWVTSYLKQYISQGGSKIKFLTEEEGSSRADCIGLFLQKADSCGFKTVSLSAADTGINDFKEIYSGIIRHVGLSDCVKKCANIVVRQMGYEPDDVPNEMSFSDYIAQHGDFTAITKRELRSQINKLFFSNPRIDKNFAVCAAHMVGDVLGYPVLEPTSHTLLNDWLTGGSRGLKVAALRRLEMSGAKITKQNARHMLRSFVELLKIAEYSGLVVCIDDLEVLIGGSIAAAIRYTKIRREDAYECIRELIDEIDTLTNTMFVFAFDKELLEDESAGLKSYQALWMRMQNEIVSERQNRFADIIDLDMPDTQAAPDSQ